MDVEGEGKTEVWEKNILASVRICQDPTSGARYHMTSVTHIYSTMDILPLYIIVIVIVTTRTVQLIP